MARVFKISALQKLAGKCQSSFKIAAPTTGLQQRQYGTKLTSNTVPKAQYGGRYTVSMLPGDGVGPEMMSYVRDVFNAAHVPVEFEEVTLNKDNNTEEDMRKALLSIRRNGVAIKGSIESKYADPHYSKSRNATLRVDLDLFVNLLHCKTYPGIPSRYNLDIAVIRQNTEGEYAMLEHETVPGVVECMKVITRAASERLGRYAFNYATKHGRKKVTCIHKANIQKMSDGLFLETVGEVAKEYPDIEFTDMIVDNTCMQLASNPHQFDVMVAPNLYGLIVQNVICGLAGGAGLYSGRNYGQHYSVFEPGTRNTGTHLGVNVANPVAMLNASVDLLRHLHLVRHANLIDYAIRKTICEDKIHTKDLGGTASSSEVVDNIIDYILDEPLGGAMRRQH